MSFQIDIHTFLTDDVFNKLKEVVSEDINLIKVGTVDELADKLNVITNDFSTTVDAQAKVLYVSNDVSTKRASISPEAIINAKENVILEIEQFFGVMHTPKQRVLKSFQSAKQYKITSRFSIGYYSDLINLKLHEKSFEVENYTNMLQSTLSELVLVKQACPVEIDLLLSDNEALFYINAFSVYIDDNLIEKISSFMSEKCSFFGLKRNDKKGQLQICFTVEKQKSYQACFVFTKSIEIKRDSVATVDISDEESIIDHKNYHDPIVKKVTVKTLKDIVEFMKNREVSEENFLDDLDAFPDKAILKILKDDEIEFIKKSVLSDTNIDLKEAITSTVKESFDDAKKFNEKFFNSIDRNTFKDLVKPESWPLDGEKLKNEIADEVLDKSAVNSYDEYVENVKEYVNGKYDVLDEDFTTVKDNAEGNIAEELIRVKGQNIEEFVRSSETVQMKSKVARMSSLFNQMKDELDKTKAEALENGNKEEEKKVISGTTQHHKEELQVISGSKPEEKSDIQVVKDNTPKEESTEDLTVVKSHDEVAESSKEDVLVIKGEEDLDEKDDVFVVKADEQKADTGKMEVKSAKDLNGEDRWIQDLESKVDQLTKELEIKNDSIEVMSRKVDEAHQLAASEKKQLANLQLKYKEELVKVESLEKELKKYNEDEAGAKGENPAEKLKEAQNEVKKYKQRLKFAQSQIQNLEKAKKAAASKGTNDKKLSHLEKMLDKQKQLKSKADTEVANYKRDNHKLSQENKILSNKIKELEMKLDKKNKSAA
ncbi:hypothetical protein DAY19_02805 [Halobacteriovorax vibrionivorans]|uniref:Uncharacterized protein n=1 Tax=Halobacteriovorax vibrionivorans TaxID=2152716 RepID=A0ABY0IMH7_9BACT|nr:MULTISPECIES: hypothetical protein [Halobacteriovorax]RZF22719.1 hypothetical protein DAY19_02805 [Halobacteriovorax vibrionivorans]TGD45807.1 hypothetical protein EP118_14670 [Halobacteriovorax sp. Y22]